MAPREKKMATQKQSTKALNTCDKCGSVMISRMIAHKNGENRPKLVKIYQCVVCRHWLPID